MSPLLLAIFFGKTNSFIIIVVCIDLLWDINQIIIHSTTIKNDVYLTKAQDGNYVAFIICLELNIHKIWNNRKLLF